MPPSNVPIAATVAGRPGTDSKTYPPQMEKEPAEMSMDELEADIQRRLKLIKETLANLDAPASYPDSNSVAPKQSGKDLSSTNPLQN